MQLHENNLHYPFLGIWWFYKNSLFYAEKTPLEEGEHYGDCIIGKADHAEIWDNLAQTGKLLELPIELRDEYFSIPRGRVVFHADTGRFSLLHGGFLKSSYRTLRRNSAFRATKLIMKSIFIIRNMNIWIFRGNLWI